MPFRPTYVRIGTGAGRIDALVDQSLDDDWLVDRRGVEGENQSQERGDGEDRPVLKLLEEDFPLAKALEQLGRNLLENPRHDVQRQSHDRLLM